MSPPPTPVKAFISYSHDSSQHMERVLKLSDRLRKDGVDCSIDQYEMSPRGGWPQWTLKQVEDAAFVLVVCTQVYARRFRGEGEAGVGRGAAWEGAIITRTLYGLGRENQKFIPVIFDARDVAHIPVELRGDMYYDLGSEEGYTQLYRRITNQPLVTRPPLGGVQTLSPLSRLDPVQQFTPILAANCRYYADMFDLEIRERRNSFWRRIAAPAILALVGLALLIYSISLSPVQPHGLTGSQFTLGAVILALGMLMAHRVIESDRPLATYKYMKQMFDRCDLPPEEIQRKMALAEQLLRRNLGIPDGGQT